MNGKYYGQREIRWHSREKERLEHIQRKRRMSNDEESNGLIFVQPRMIPIHVNGEITECQRPLRAQTASLANSEQIPAGSTCEFEIVLLDDSHEKVVREWLDYGALRGIGQWRNSGKGRYTYEILN